MLAVERRRFNDGPGAARVVWTVIFSLLAAVDGGSLAAGSVNGVGATSFVAICGWFIAYWRAGVIFLLILACVDGFIKLYHQGWATLLLKDITVASIMIGLAAFIALHPKVWQKQRWTGAGLVIFYVAFEAIEILNPGAQKVAAVAGFRAHAFFCVLFFVGALYFTSQRVFTLTLRVAIGGIAFACLVGIIQYILGPTWEELGPGFLAASQHYVSQGAPGSFSLFPGQSNTIERAYGTLVDPTALGMAAGFGIVYAVSQLVTTGKAWIRVLMVVAASVMLVAMLLSGTRAALVSSSVSFIALIFILGIRRQTRSFVFIALGLAILAVPLGLWATQSATSTRFTARSEQLAIETRQRSAAIVFRTVSVEPFGVGLGSAGAGGKARQKQKGITLAIDNAYLATLYETGPIGVGALLVMQLGILFLTWRAALRAKNVMVSSSFAAIGAAQLGLLAGAAINQGAFDYAPIAQMFWLFSGAITMPERLDDPPALVAPGPARRIVPFRERFPRLRALPGFGRKTIVAEPVAPVRPITDDEIDAALDRFRAHMRANLQAGAALGPFASRDGDEILKLASRKLFMSLKKAMAAADDDPESAEKALRVVNESADVAAMMLALSEIYGKP